MPRTVPKSTRERTLTGSDSKKATLLALRARSWGSRGSRLIALRCGSADGADRARLDAEGAAGAVLRVDLQRVAGVRAARPRRGAPMAKLLGAPASAPSSKYLARSTLCGQTKLQLPHWMHVSGSHVATRSLIRRFS